MYGNSLLKYTEGGDTTSQYSYLVAILSNWVPDHWVYRFLMIASAVAKECILTNAPGVLAGFLAANFDAV